MSETVGETGGPTVKPVNGGEVPPGVVTVTVRVVNSAPELIVMVAGRSVLVPPEPNVLVTATPLPLNVRAVAPVRFVPVIVPAMFLPCAPEVGLIAVMTGAGTAVATKTTSTQ